MSYRHAGCYECAPSPNGKNMDHKITYTSVVKTVIGEVISSLLFIANLDLGTYRIVEHSRSSDEDSNEPSKMHILTRALAARLHKAWIQ